MNPSALITRRTKRGNFRTLVISTSIRERGQFRKVSQITPEGDRVKYRGLVADAAMLGVHHNHLYMVLSGRRKSTSLLRRYRALKRGNPKN